DPPIGGPWTVPGECVGMQQVSEKLRSIDHARARSRKVRIRVDGKNTLVADGGQVLPAFVLAEFRSLFDDFVDVETAGNNDEYFRIPVQDIAPRDANGIGAFPAPRVNAARDFHEFGHPVAAAINRIQPFHAEDSRTTG